jgi:cell division protein FtsL
MGVLTLLLTGLVALNVTALRSTIAMSKANTQARHLQQEIRLQQAQIAKLSSSTRISAKAQSYGMTQSAPPARHWFSLKEHTTPVRSPGAGGPPG